MTAKLNIIIIQLQHYLSVPSEHEVCWQSSLVLFESHHSFLVIPKFVPVLSGLLYRIANMIPLS